MKKLLIQLIAFSSLGYIGCSHDDSVADSQYIALSPEEGEQFSGGDVTVNNATQEAFGFFASNHTSEQEEMFAVGNSFFRQSWVVAPSSTTARDGLGPFFNANSCSACHFKDGRGRPPAFDNETGTGLLLRLSIAGTDAHGGPAPHPIYGGQLQDNAILGQMIKGRIAITYEDIAETFADGTDVTLQKPSYSIVNTGYGNPGDAFISPRISSQIIGVGLLEAIPESTILASADENDANRDGISGRPNYVYDGISGSNKLGRFGWKANQATIRQQVAAAFSNDMGITSSLFPSENCPPGVDCNLIPNGGSPEIPDDVFDRVVLYSQTLAVPIRRNYKDQNVLEGKQIFSDLKCAACHSPKMQTGNDHPVIALRNQTIRPYTDLLLHDMGAGLADGATDFLATGSEWRTPPLWGIGLLPVVNGQTRLMHDGRARSIEEAILWHGGEAEQAKSAYKQLSATQRAKLLAFINSL